MRNMAGASAHRLEPGILKAPSSHPRFSEVHRKEVAADVRLGSSKQTSRIRSLPDILQSNATSLRNPWRSGRGPKRRFCTAAQHRVSETALIRAPLIRAPSIRAPLIRGPFIRAPLIRAPSIRAPLRSGPFVRASLIRASQAGRSSNTSEQSSDEDKPPIWSQFVLKGLLGGAQDKVGEKIMASLLKTTQAPIGMYVAEPVTPLHRLDPRVKQVWLFALMLLPARSTLAVRIGLVSGVLFLSMLCLPRRLWKAQLAPLVFLSCLVFVLTAFTADGVTILAQPKSLPPPQIGLPEIPPAAGGYRYVLFSWWVFRITRKGLLLASSAASLAFMVIQAANLCLTTTTPEELVASLRWFMRPLKYLGVNVAEVALTLLLSLRFTGLVFDEVRNLALGVVARGIDWKKLGFAGTTDLIAGLAGRLFQNLFAQADQIAQAMVARGFRGRPEDHQIYLMTRLRLGLLDVVAILLLGFVLFVTWNQKSPLVIRS